MAKSDTHGGYNACHTRLRLTRSYVAPQVGGVSATVVIGDEVAPAVEPAYKWQQPQYMGSVCPAGCPSCTGGYTPIGYRQCGSLPGASQSLIQRWSSLTTIYAARHRPGSPFGIAPRS
jgi:hypothetical protein